MICKTRKSVNHSAQPRTHLRPSWQPDATLPAATLVISSGFVCVGSQDPAETKAPEVVDPGIWKRCFWILSFKS